jgi:hypothetical protein
MYCDWAWDPLNMSAVTLKDPGYVDFMLNNLRKFVTKLNEQSQNTSYNDKLLISIVISRNSKFSIFFWFTTSSISILLIFKAYATTKVINPALIEFNIYLDNHIDKMLITSISSFFNHPSGKMYPSNLFMAPNPMLRIFKAREGFHTYVSDILSLFYYLEHCAFYTTHLYIYRQCVSTYVIHHYMSPGHILISSQFCILYFHVFMHPLIRVN